MPRELTLFHVSIISNVSLGEPDVTRLEVERALRQAGAPGFVSQLSDGIDHLVDLSGGAVAAYFAGSRVTLQSLTATSALVPVTEAEIVSNRRTLASRGGITILAISRQPA